jgi:hypothetical protein
LGVQQQVTAANPFENFSASYNFSDRRGTADSVGDFNSLVLALTLISENPPAA